MHRIAAVAAHLCSAGPQGSALAAPTAQSSLLAADGDVAADVELSDAEMDFYRGNGYAVLPGVVNEDACAHMYEEVLEICEKDPKIGLR